ncbi:Holliday junction branch migration DNA helicase RuvB [Candidatus Dojkabacteria bacterium]|nr:Holliday junction branch migration DNA helicase RuvB [Candidatus Dojkabacteria bacterium]
MIDEVTNLETNNEEERTIEKSLRPKTFSDVIGRTSEIQNLRIMIKAAKKRGIALDHLIFHGPPGLGKTAISYVVAHEMGVPLHITSGPAIERQGDLASILTGIEEKAILFIDEIHRLNRVVEEVLYPAMEDRAIDVVIGKGPSAKTLRLELSSFTLIGATTRMGRISAPLRDRFGANFRFGFYDYEDLARIVQQKADVLETTIDKEAAYEIARRSRKTPRIAIRILKRMRDFADVNNDGKITKKEVVEGLKMLNIDRIGLDYLDRKILQTIIENFEGGPVGLSTIAASISEDLETIEDVCEPFLLREGLIKRTPRGRVVTKKGIEHMKESGESVYLL